VDRAGGFQRLLEHRWVLVPLAVMIELVSLFLFSVTVERDYWEYLIYPKEKAVDNYIYPVVSQRYANKINWLSETG
jgi:hypothetical protein